MEQTGVWSWQLGTNKDSSSLWSSSCGWECSGRGEMGGGSRDSRLVESAAGWKAGSQGAWSPGTVKRRKARGEEGQGR